MPCQFLVRGAKKTRTAEIVSNLAYLAFASCSVPSLRKIVYFFHKTFVIEIINLGFF